MQRHKAEEDIAVAAASILARDEFVKGLAKLEKQFNMELPKGASSAVDAAAKKFVDGARRGESAENCQGAFPHGVARARLARAAEKGMAKDGDEKMIVHRYATKGTNAIEDGFDPINSKVLSINCGMSYTGRTFTTISLIEASKFCREHEKASNFYTRILDLYFAGAL